MASSCKQRNNNKKKKQTHIKYVRIANIIKRRRKKKKKKKKHYEERKYQINIQKVLDGMKIILYQT